MLKEGKYVDKDVDLEPPLYTIPLQASPRRVCKTAWVVIHNAVNHAMERALGCTGDGTPDLDVSRCFPTNHLNS